MLNKPENIESLVCRKLHSTGSMRLHQLYSFITDRNICSSEDSEVYCSNVTKSELAIKSSRISLGIRAVVFNLFGTVTRKSNSL